MGAFSSFIASSILGATLWLGGEVRIEGGGEPGGPMGMGAGTGARAERAAAAVAEPPRGTKLAWRPGGPPRLLWTGFRVEGGRARVMLQISGEAALESRPSPEGAGAGALFVLKRCRVVRRTDRLPLETLYFDSAVTRVEVRQRGADVEVAVALRRPLSAAPRREPGPSGSTFWILDFPANAGAPATTAAASR